MSSVPQVGPVDVDPTFYYVRVVVRNGNIERVRRCRGCQREGFCRDPRITDSPGDFAVKERREDGSVGSWHGRCKSCYSTKQRAERPAKAERINAERRERYVRQMQDPVFAERKRARDRASQRRRWKDPEKREKMKAQSKAWHRRRKKERPQEVLEEGRMYYALRRERAGTPVKRTRPTVIDDTVPRVPLEPFREWLVTYRDELDIDNHAALAFELGIEPRRVFSTLDRAYENVSADVVDRALQNARTFVTVRGRLITRFDDLYGDVRLRG